MSTRREATWIDYIVLVTIFLVACIFLSAGVSVVDPAPTEAEKKADRAAVLQAQADRIVQEIYYVKDPRTGLCFAYHVDAHGVSFTSVPCEAVPKELLMMPSQLPKK